MSYSFNVRAASKALALVAVAEAMAQVVVSQPAHVVDQDACLAAANTQINLLPDDDSKDVAVSCNGYLGWEGIPGQPGFSITTALTGCLAQLMTRKAEEIQHVPV